MRRLAGAFLAGIAVPFALLAAPAAATTSERVVTDRLTGLAINGFDPVAYFTDAEPRVGREEFEHSAVGATWRFRNEGNRAAFRSAPEIYAPKFGGYDPVAIVRGVAAPGHPQLWVVHRQRLYLFYSEEARRKFVASPETITDDAEDRWPDVLRALVP